MDADDRLTTALADDLDGTFEALVVAHQDRLYTIALRMLGDPRDAEEAAQDALVRAYRALAAYDPERIRELRLRGWLTTIVLNRCRSVGARRTARGPRPVSLEGDPARPGASRRRPQRAARREVAERHGERDLWAARLAALPGAVPEPRRAAPRRRPVLPRGRRRPRPTRGHRQGPGPPGIALLRTMLEADDPPRARGDDRMTQPLDATATETAALADLATTAPLTLRESVLVEVGLADRYAAIDSPLGPLVVAWNGRGVSAVDTPATTARSKRATWPATGRRAIRGDAARRGWPSAIARRLDGDRRVRIPLDLRGHSAVRAGRLAQGARDPARRGPAVRLDRRRDRPAEGGPGRRHGAGPQPRAAHRPVPPGRPDRRHRSASTRSAGRRTSGRSSRPRGSTRTRMEDAARRGERLVGCATTHIVCWPTCRTGRRMLDAQPPAVPVAGRGGARPATGRARCAGRSTAPPPDRPGTASRATAYAVAAWTSQTMPTTTARPAAIGAAIWRRDARPVRRLGLDLPRHRGRGRDHPAVPHGGVPVRAGRGCSCSAGSACAPTATSSIARPGASCATRRSSARCCSAAAWAWSRGASRPSRPGSPRCSSRRCRSGSRSSAGSSSASACRGWPVVGIVVGFIGRRDPRRPDRARREPARSTRAGLAAVLVSPIAWSTGSLFAAHRATLPRDPLVATGGQMLAGAGVLALMVDRSRRARPVRAGGHLDRVAGRVRLPRDRRQPDRVHDLRLAAPGRAAAARHDVRLRQPGRGRHPRRARPAAKPIDAADDRGRRGHRRRGGAHRDRPRPDGEATRAADGHASARTVRATRRASAITVSIGLTPSAVGNSEASAT